MTSPGLSTLPATPPSLEKREGVMEVWRIQVTQLPAGVYFVRVVDADGGVVVRRFIKE